MTLDHEQRQNLARHLRFVADGIADGTCEVMEYDIERETHALPDNGVERVTPGKVFKVAAEVRWVGVAVEA